MRGVPGRPDLLRGAVRVLVLRGGPGAEEGDPGAGGARARAGAAAAGRALRLRPRARQRGAQEQNQPSGD